MYQWQWVGHLSSKASNLPILCAKTCLSQVRVPHCQGVVSLTNVRDTGQVHGIGKWLLQVLAWKSKLACCMLCGYRPRWITGVDVRCNTRYPLHMGGRRLSVVKYPSN